jgi:hypothetical protein
MATGDRTVKTIQARETVVTAVTGTMTMTEMFTKMNSGEETRAIRPAVTITRIFLKEPVKD